MMLSVGGTESGRDPGRAARRRFQDQSAEPLPGGLQRRCREVWRRRAPQGRRGVPERARWNRPAAEILDAVRAAMPSPARRLSKHPALTIRSHYAELSLQSVVAVRVETPAKAARTAAVSSVKRSRVVCGGAALLIPAAAGIAAFLNPLRQKSQSGRFLRVASLDVLPDGRHSAKGARDRRTHRRLEPLSGGADRGRFSLPEAATR